MANSMSNVGASRWLVGLGLASLAFSFLVAGLAFSPSKEEDGKPKKADPTARRAVAVAFVDVPGGVVNLHPARPGRVVELPVKEGSEVRKGDVLMRIDDTLAKLELAKADAQVKLAEEKVEAAKQIAAQHEAGIKALEALVKSAEGDVKSAKAMEAKARRFKKDDLGSSAEDVLAAQGQVLKAEGGLLARKAELLKLEKTDPQAAVRLAEKAVALAEAQLAEAKEGVEMCKVRAPEDGTVLRLSVSVGEVLSQIPNPQKPVPMVFCSKDKMIVRAEVEQEFATQVKLGLKAEILDDATTGGGKWTGQVERIGGWYTSRRVVMMEPMQFNDVRTLEVIVSVDKSDKPLRIGQRMRVMLEGVGP
ncbi:MAG: biotin/lipoyl-binding protein [Gemmataceae bacterium]|nr:biotin/lipoyl-binding protein [Gemmataceae bacterium]